MKEVTYVLQKQMFQQKLNLADIAIASLSSQLTICYVGKYELLPFFKIDSIIALCNDN